MFFFNLGIKWCQICHILLQRKCLGSQFEHDWLSRTKAVVKTIPASLYMLFQNWGSNTEKSQNRGSNIKLRLKCAKYQSMDSVWSSGISFKVQGQWKNPQKKNKGIKLEDFYPRFDPLDGGQIPTWGSNLNKNMKFNHLKKPFVLVLLKKIEK